MKSSYVKKSMVLAIILLIIGLGVFTSNAHVVKNSSNSTVGQGNSDDYTNYLGTIYFNVSRFSVEIGFTVPENRNYTFPVIDGMVKINFTIEFIAKLKQNLFFPRIALWHVKFSPDDDPHYWAIFNIHLIRRDYVLPIVLGNYSEDYNDYPFNGMENVTFSIRLQGRGFPFGFLKAERILFTITTHFVEEK